MCKFTSGLIFVTALLLPVLANAKSSPFGGRWDFNITTQNGTRANWLGVTEKKDKLEVWFQPTGGNVYEVRNFNVEGSHLTLTLSAATPDRPALTWEFDADGDKPTGGQKRGDNTMALTVVRATSLTP